MEYWAGPIPQIIGPRSATLTFNAANVYRGIRYVPHENKTLNAIRCHATTINGTPTNGMSLGIYEQTSRYTASPTISLLSSGTLTPAVGWNQVTSLSQSLTKNKTYWILVRNVHATPSTNNWVMNTYYLGGPSLATGAGTTATSLSNLLAYHAPGIRLAFSDGSYWGCPLQSYDVDTTLGVYSAREVGEQWTIAYACTAIGMYFQGYGVTGTPTGNPRLRYYTGSTPTHVETISDLYSGPQGSATFGWGGSNVGTFYGYFSGDVSISAGTVVNVTLGETTNSDTSSNRLDPAVHLWDSDSNSIALLPHSSKSIYYDGSSWTTNTSKQLLNCGLILKNGSAYTSGGGSTGVSRSRLFGGEIG